MINGKKVLVVGAGNAGRPVANLLNYLGNQIVVTDSKKYEDLPKKAQRKINLLKERGISFDLGFHDFDILNSIDAVYISPNIPETVDFIVKIHELVNTGKLDIIGNRDVGKILNSLIAMPMLGIAGTDGKTTTTNMINFQVENSYNTLTFSSLQDSLVIEGLVEMLVNGVSKNKDLAIFELPHGTIRMADGLELDACIVTNLTPDHMDEFNSYSEYIDRNIAIEKLLMENGLVLVNGDDPIISTRLNSFTHDYIVYGLVNPQTIEFEGTTYYNDKIKYDFMAIDIELNGLGGSSYKIKSKEIPTLICNNCGFFKEFCNCGNFIRKIIAPFKVDVNINVPGMVNVENSLATILMSLILGFEIDDAIKRISNFNGVKGRFEKIDTFNGINIFMDAAHNPESMEKLFNGLDVSGRLILSLDNPDTLTSRDKTKIGEILGKVVDVLITSSKNETTEVVDCGAAIEVLEGAGEIESYITDSVSESISYALSIADTGDTIIHIGPGVVNAYDNVKNDIKEAIDFFKAIFGKVVVIGGCGTVGSLIGRVLAANNVDVTISDLVEDSPLKEVFEKEGIELDLGSNHDKNLLANASSFFLAPSLMRNSKLIADLKESNSNENVPILGIDEIFKFFKTNKLVFGVTGTNGKTTTTEMLKHVFKTAGLKVPQHYLNIQGNTEFIPSLQSRLSGDIAVIEVGTFGNKGEIEAISRRANVDTGIITNITPDHLKSSNNNDCSGFEDYISCKKEMVDVADNLILCGDDPIVSYFGSYKDKEDLLFFGINNSSNFATGNYDVNDNVDNSVNVSEDINKNINDDVNVSENINDDTINKDLNDIRFCPICSKELNYNIHYLGHLGSYNCDCGFKNPDLDVEARNIQYQPNGLMKYTLKIHENQGEVILQNPGIANVYNSLATATGAWLSGIDFEDIIKGINSFKGVSGRFEIIADGCSKPMVILDYAHNPAGVNSVIQTLRSIRKGNENQGKLIVLNTISSESGEEGDLEIAKLLSNADIVIPISHAAYLSSKYIDVDNFNCEVKHIKSSIEGTKVGTLGASYNQVKEGIELAIDLANDNQFSVDSKSEEDNSNIKEGIGDCSNKDIILIIGEGGLKYSREIIDELDNMEKL